MARRLVADDHEVTVVTTNARQASDFWQPPTSGLPDLPTREVLDGVSVERLALTYPRPAPYLFGLLRRAGLWLHLSKLPACLTWPVQLHLSRWMPPLAGLSQTLDRLVSEADLIHADDSSWDGLYVAASRMARRHGKPLVVRPLMHLGSSWVRAHHQMAHQLEVYRQAAVVLALSQTEAEAYATLGVPASRIRVVRMGVEPANELSAEDLDIEGFRRDLAVEGPIIAFVGANTYDKGAFTLAEAVLELNARGLPVNLVCAGPQREDLDRFLQRQSREAQAVARDRIRVLGIVDEATKRRLLAACELFALPSQVDTFGIVFLEAWLHGKPVIGARAGGIPDLVRDEENGLLVRFGDIDALTEAIRRLLAAPMWARHMGENGRKSLRSYTWQATYDALLEAYHFALAGVP
jgi:glycosyltransferase involved in cell wall biosynthesis